MSYEIPSDADIEITDEVEFSISDLITSLLSNPSFIQQVAILVRNQLTKDARRMGNIYGKNAQQQPPLPSTNQKRVQ